MESISSRTFSELLGLFFLKTGKCGYDEDRNKSDEMASERSMEHLTSNQHVVPIEQGGNIYNYCFLRIKLVYVVTRIYIGV